MNPIISPITLPSGLILRAFRAVQQIAELLRTRSTCKCLPRETNPSYKLVHCFRHLIWVVLLVPFQGRATMPGIVPKPVSMVEGSGAFLLAPDTGIDADAASQQTARRLKQALAPATGFDFASQSGGNTIEIRKDSSLANLGNEGYDLSVTPTKIVIRSSGEAGQTASGYSECRRMCRIRVDEGRGRHHTRRFRIPFPRTASFSGTVNRTRSLKTSYWFEAIFSSSRL